MVKVRQMPESIMRWWVCFLRLRRSSVVEKVPAGGRVSSLNPDHLKPMRKRKRKEYLSPSEEDSDIEGAVRPAFTLFLHPSVTTNKLGPFEECDNIA